MADWGEIQRGVASGFQIGQQAGGRFTGLQSALDAILAQHKAKQEMEQKKQLLGYEGLMSGKVSMAKPEDTDTIDVPGLGKVVAKGETAYQQGVDDKGNPTLIPVGKITKGDKILPIKPGMAPSDIEEAAQLLAQGLEVPGQLSSFSKQKQQVINRAREINPSFNPRTADIAFGAEKSVMTNVKLPDAKVLAANQLMTLLDSNYDPKTDTYTIPPTLHTELALGTARMLSPTGVVPIELEQQLRQNTAKENFAQTAIWLGLDPMKVGGSTQGVIKMFRDTIARQGAVAQEQRAKYLKGEVSDFQGGYKPIRQSDQTGMPDVTKMTDEQLKALING